MQQLLVRNSCLYGTASGEFPQPESATPSPLKSVFQMHARFEFAEMPIRLFITEPSRARKTKVVRGAADARCQLPLQMEAAERL